MKIPQSQCFARRSLRSSSLRTYCACATSRFSCSRSARTFKIRSLSACRPSLVTSATGALSMGVASEAGGGAATASGAGSSGRWVLGVGPSCWRNESPVPGIPTFTAEPRGPTVTLAPRGPMLAETPRLEKFRRTPGNSVTRRENRRPIWSSSESPRLASVPTDEGSYFKGEHRTVPVPRRIGDSSRCPPSPPAAEPHSADDGRELLDAPAIHQRRPYALTVRCPDLVQTHGDPRGLG